MRRKRTPSDLALWAALPMAQTSRIERRLKMILDQARSRRGLTRVTIILALIGVASFAAMVASAQDQSRMAAKHSIFPAQAGTQIPQVFTPWTSVYNTTTWGPRKTYRLTENISPSVQGSYPDPPVRAVLVSGPGRVANFSVRLWKPGKSNMLTVSYDYTPVKTDKVHADVIHLLTKKGAVASEITWKQR